MCCFSPWNQWMSQRPQQNDAVRRWQRFFVEQKMWDTQMPVQQTTGETVGTSHSTVRRGWSLSAETFSVSSLRVRPIVQGFWESVCVYWVKLMENVLINMSSSVWSTNNDSAHQRDAVYVNDMFLQLLSTSIYMHLGHANPLQPSSVCASCCLPLSMLIRDACRIVLEWLVWTSVREVRISGDLTMASVIVIVLMFCDAPFICNSHCLQFGCAILGSDV